MSYYSECRKARLEIKQMVSAGKDEDSIILRITEMFEVSEKMVRDRIKLIEKIKSEVCSQ